MPKSATTNQLCRYHGKCFKIARGKVREDDGYTCPICDYRVKIPRDAARPKLEDLENWHADLEDLPFQPEEEDILNKIVGRARAFRDYLATTVMANRDMGSTPDDLPNQRFYLRKIEGAEVLLVEETNFLRSEVHKWAPIAPNPPEMITVSKSTRKPRPTKAERLAAIHQCSVRELPFELQPRHVKKQLQQETTKGPTALSTSYNDGDSPPGTMQSQNDPEVDPSLDSALAPRSPTVLRSPLRPLAPASPVFAHPSAQHSPHSYNMSVQPHAPMQGQSYESTPSRSLSLTHHTSPNADSSVDAVDPALEGWASHPTAGGAVEEEMEEMFGSLTNGSGDGFEFEAKRRAEEEGSGGGSGF
jgi:histone demethylase JARID1